VVGNHNKQRLRVLRRLLRLRELPAHLIAFGVWTVHVKDT